MIEGTIMKGSCLRVGGEFLALADDKEAALVVKRPRVRVEELIASGEGRPFGPAGKVFRKWASLPVVDRERWLAVLREGLAHASLEAAR